MIHDEIGQAEDSTGPFTVMPAAAMANPMRYGIMPGAEVKYTIQPDGTAHAAQATAKIKGE